jgi:hypothetical protein
MTENTRVQALGAARCARLVRGPTVAVLRRATFALTALRACNVMALVFPSSARRVNIAHRAATRAGPAAATRNFLGPVLGHAQRAQYNRLLLEGLRRLAQHARRALRAVIAMALAPRRFARREL